MPTHQGGEGVHIPTINFHPVSLTLDVWLKQPENRVTVPDDADLHHQVLDEVEGIVREILRETGYRSEVFGINPDTCDIQVRLHHHSIQIAEGVRYGGEEPVAVDTMVLSTQHDTDVPTATVEQAVIHELSEPVIPEALRSDSFRYLINPAGRFEIGGPLGDARLSGRKIIVDTYGGRCPHGGGAFSGKDVTLVDRSGTYAARWVAKHLVAPGLAQRATVQLSQAGRSEIDIAQ